MPPLRLGNPRWTFSTPFDAPIMVVCMGVMSSSFSPFEEKSSSASIVLETESTQHKGEPGCGNKENQNNC
jgi:hypothetical protein